MFHKDRPDQWEKMIGTMIEMRTLPGKYAPHPKVFVVELHPEGREPVQAEVHWDVNIDERLYKGDLRAPLAREVTGFIVNRVSGEVRLDMSDPRNSMTAQEAEFKRLEALDDEDEPAGPGESVTGPPWIVPDKCPSCGAMVDHATASIEQDPRCEFCHQPLPVEPRSRF